MYCQKMQEKKKLCHIITKVYLLRWRIEEYFKFIKQQFELEDLRVMSLQSIRSLNFFATLAAGYISLISSSHRESIFLKELRECSKRIYEVPKFIFYALGYAINRVLGMSRQVWYTNKNKTGRCFMGVYLNPGNIASVYRRF